MRSFSLLPVFFIAMVVVACGCTQTVSETNPPVPAESTATPALTMTNATPEVTTVPPQPADPIIGNWIGYQYIASGRVEKTWTFRENNTWTMTNRNVKSQNRKVVNGTWTRTGTTTYKAVPAGGAPDTFTYDPATDQLSDTYFQGTYYRYSGSVSATTRPPSLNITLNSAQAVLAISGSRPTAGNRYLIVNISVTNVNETNGYVFSDDNARVTTPEMPVSKAINQKVAGKLANPFPTQKIGIGETRQGNIIFGMPASSTSFTLGFIDSSGNAISDIIARDAIWTNETYSESPG